MIIQSEQLDDRCDIVLAFDVVTDPSRFWMQVVQRCLACGHQLLTNADGHRKVRQALSVEMPDLTTANVEENHALTVSIDPNVRP